MSPTEKLRYKEMADYGFGPLILKKTRVCTYCKSMIKGNAKSCPDCGEKLPKETLFDRYKKHHACCPHCDTVLSADSRYCPNCGIVISAIEA